MVEIFILPRNFQSGDERETWELSQEVGVKAILEFNIGWLIGKLSSVAK